MSPWTLLWLHDPRGSRVRKADRMTIIQSFIHIAVLSSSVDYPVIPDRECICRLATPQCRREHPFSQSILPLLRRLSCQPSRGDSHPTLNSPAPGLDSHQATLLLREGSVILFPRALQLAGTSLTLLHGTGHSSISKPLIRIPYSLFLTFLFRFCSAVLSPAPDLPASVSQVLELPVHITMTA